MNINLYDPIEFIKRVSKSMIEAGGGRIINVTKNFAKLLGGKGIIINAVSPGPAETDMLNVIPEQRKKEIKSNTVLNRFVKSEEVAKEIYWLATDCPEYINRTCINMNNGAFPR